VTDRQRVAVIGGGIAGVSAAWALAADHDVILLEAEPELATHATGRSAAMLSETSGPRAVCALARASRHFFERPPGGFTEHPLSAPRGLLWIGRDGDERGLEEIARVAASGVAPTARRIDAAEACRVVPVLRESAVGGGGVFEPDARSIDVAALVAAYAAAARARGAAVRRRSAVRALSPTSEGGWSLRVDSSSGGHELLTVDTVVNAAGAWGDHVAEAAGVSPLGLRPLRRTACLVPVPVDVSTWPLVMDVASRLYFEPETGGLLLSPADEHPSEAIDARAEMEDVAWALEMLAEATTLDVRHVRSSWAGLRTFTTDRIPAVGWDATAPRFCWLVGQGGAGIKTAPALAAIVASVVGGTAWPADVAALGVGPADLAPARLRQPADPVT
jgi:D-arginine dehydrogenase